jgi:hypothetical protein
MRSATVKKEHVQGKGHKGSKKIEKGQYKMDDDKFD